MDIEVIDGWWIYWKLVRIFVFYFIIFVSFGLIFVNKVFYVDVKDVVLVYVVVVLDFEVKYVWI